MAFMSHSLVGSRVSLTRQPHLWHSEHLPSTMPLKRSTTAPFLGNAKKNKVDFFNTNFASTSSSSTQRTLAKQVSEPHGGQPAIDSQTSEDSLPMSVSCQTLAETVADDEQPLVKLDTAVEVDDPDTDKESAIVLQDMNAGGTNPDTQIDMDETKAEDMHTGEPEKKPTDNAAANDKTEEVPDDTTEEVPDGFTTPPTNALRALIDAVDSDPEACGKVFQKMAGTQTKIDQDSAEALETNFEKLADQFAEVSPEQRAPDGQCEGPPNPKIAKKRSELEDIINNKKMDSQSTLAQSFRREHGHDPSFKTMGKVAAQKFKVEWAKKQLTALTTEHTKTESFSRVDRTKGTYKNFSQLVVSQGGICMGGEEHGTTVWSEGYKL